MSASPPPSTSSRFDAQADVLCKSLDMVVKKALIYSEMIREQTTQELSAAPSSSSSPVMEDNVPSMLQRLSLHRVVSRRIHPAATHAKDASQRGHHHGGGTDEYDANEGSDDDDDEEEEEDDDDALIFSRYRQRLQSKTEQRRSHGDGTTVGLLPHQQYGCAWLTSLYLNGLHGILADEMGLGKSVQVVSFLAVLALKLDPTEAMEAADALEQVRQQGSRGGPAAAQRLRQEWREINARWSATWVSTRRLYNRWHAYTPPPLDLMGGTPCTPPYPSPPHLLVVPLAVLDHWTEEVSKWCPSLPIIVYYGTARKREEIRHEIRKRWHRRWLWMHGLASLEEEAADTSEASAGLGRGKRPRGQPPKMDRRASHEGSDEDDAWTERQRATASEAEAAATLRRSAGIVVTTYDIVMQDRALLLSHLHMQGIDGFDLAPVLASDATHRDPRRRGSTSCSSTSSSDATSSSSSPPSSILSTSGEDEDASMVDATKKKKRTTKNDNHHHGEDGGDESSDDGEISSDAADTDNRLSASSSSTSSLAALLDQHADGTLAAVGPVAPKRTRFTKIDLENDLPIKDSVMMRAADDGKSTTSTPQPTIGLPAENVSPAAGAQAAAPPITTSTEPAPPFWSVLVVDEAHRLKNFDCKLIRTLRHFPCETRLLLTGTPLQNRVKELWSILNFVVPEVFENVTVFEKWFEWTRSVTAISTNTGTNTTAGSPTKGPGSKRERNKLIINASSGSLGSEEWMREPGGGSGDGDVAGGGSAPTSPVVPDSTAAIAGGDAEAVEIDQSMAFDRLVEEERRRHETAGGSAVADPAPLLSLAEAALRDQARRVLSMHQILRPFMLRRTKMDIPGLRLPTKAESLIYCPWPSTSSSSSDARRHPAAPRTALRASSCLSTEAGAKTVPSTTTSMDDTTLSVEATAAWLRRHAIEDFMSVYAPTTIPVGSTQRRGRKHEENGGAGAFQLSTVNRQMLRAEWGEANAVCSRAGLGPGNMKLDAALTHDLAKPKGGRGRRKADGGEVATTSAATATSAAVVATSSSVDIGPSSVSYQAQVYNAVRYDPEWYKGRLFYLRKVCCHPHLFAEFDPFHDIVVAHEGRSSWWFPMPTAAAMGMHDEGEETPKKHAKVTENNDEATKPLRPSTAAVPSVPAATTVVRKKAPTREALLPGAFRVDSNPAPTTLHAPTVLSGDRETGRDVNVEEPPVVALPRCSSPTLLRLQVEYYATMILHSSKFHVMHHLLPMLYAGDGRRPDQGPQHPTLIFSQFTSVLDLIHDYLWHRNRFVVIFGTADPWMLLAMVGSPLRDAMRRHRREGGDAAPGGPSGVSAAAAVQRDSDVTGSLTMTATLMMDADVEETDTALFQPTSDDHHRPLQPDGSQALIDRTVEDACRHGVVSQELRRQWGLHGHPPAVWEFEVLDGRHTKSARKEAVSTFNDASPDHDVKQSTKPKGKQANKKTTRKPGKKGTSEADDDDRVLKFEYDAPIGGRAAISPPRDATGMASDAPPFLFLISTRAGGLGLNLTRADSVIIFDADFNPHNDLQAQDRCHRIGQQRPVWIGRFVCPGTVEERLLDLNLEKLKLERMVIHEGLLRPEQEAWNATPQPSTAAALSSVAAEGDASPALGRGPEEERLIQAMKRTASMTMVGGARTPRNRLPSTEELQLALRCREVSTVSSMVA